MRSHAPEPARSLCAGPAVMTGAADPLAHPDIALPLARLLAIRLWARQGPRSPIQPVAQGRLGRTPGLIFRELRAYQAG
ncbi:TPA: DUF58 domain-containing protein, partial [Aeromonas dhakensis]|nr:DUF58 domain-containing protein [Aeromonas dhakensis]